LKLTLGFLRQVKLHLQVPPVKIIQKTGEKRQEKMQASRIMEIRSDTDLNFIDPSLDINKNDRVLNSLIQEENALYFN